MNGSSKSKGRVEVRVAPTTHDDLPGIVACESLALAGAFPPYDLLAQLLYPDRAPLAQSGVHPKHWPGFSAGIRERSLNLHDGSLLFTAFVTNEEGKEVVVGGAWMTPPRDVLERKREGRTWIDRMLHDVVYPMVENVRSKLSNDVDGTDTRLWSIFKKECEAIRDRVDPGRRCFIINMLFVHPSFNGRGVGSALLAKCVSVADAEGRPLLLESSPAGIPLYTSRGFTQVDTVNIKYSGKHIVMPSMVRQPTRSQPNGPEVSGS